ncbi:hypothetical protein NSS70_02785 [Aeribacillus sp. FSL K6-2848]|uniref:hypothetical protein n=1 Tax=unclassified Aeribacillus TaxID=2640495 RepID=UPI0030D3ABF6
MSLLNYSFCKRLYMYIVENGKKRELLNSTFHDGLLLDIGDYLIKLSNGEIVQGTIETHENALKYTFKKSQNRLFIDCFS